MPPAETRRCEEGEGARTDIADRYCGRQTDLLAASEALEVGFTEWNQPVSAVIAARAPSPARATGGTETRRAADTRQPGSRSLPALLGLGLLFLLVSGRSTRPGKGRGRARIWLRCPPPPGSGAGWSVSASAWRWPRGGGGRGGGLLMHVPGHRMPSCKSLLRGDRARLFRGGSARAGAGRGGPGEPISPAEESPWRKWTVTINKSQINCDNERRGPRVLLSSRLFYLF